MLGRAAYQTPALLGVLSTHDLFGSDGRRRSIRHWTLSPGTGPISRRDWRKGFGLSSITRHMLGLFNGQPGARLWRRTLSEKAPKPGAGLDVLDEALEAVALRTVA